ncbi:MAG: (d)CMP kinase [Oscillospiraceae bacterium]|nr:(d)CMP kinase [Oscillospiraceae bacterium]
MSINIAIDGPSGAGKSSISKKVAALLGFIYVDTGALYRAVAYHVISKEIPPKNESAVIQELPKIKPELRFIDGSQHVFLNGADVSEKIRTPEISMGASDVSAIPAVRDFLFELQRSIARENNVIMDGRDIGTVVLPNADLKIYLTASAEERARRRHLELTEKGDKSSFDEVLADVNKRDYNDMNRKTAPLKQADDAVLADTTKLDFDEAVDLILKISGEVLGVRNEV